MSRQRILPPASIEAEEALLGAILLRPIIMRDLLAQLRTQDFFKPSHQHIFEVICWMFENGQPIDVITVAEALKRTAQLEDCGGMEHLMALQNSTPAISNYASYTNTIIDMSRRRRLIHAFSDLTEGAFSDKAVDEILADATSLSADSLIAPREAKVKGLYSLADFVIAAEMEEQRAEWLAPHILKPRWRVMIVAAEGVGKAVLMRFLAMHIAAGRDPWMPTEFITPRRVLYIDVENPMETIMHQQRISHRRLPLITEAIDADNLYIWHREGGMNLRDRRTQAELESLLSSYKPEIVMAGPVYKLYRRSPREDMEMAALEFTEILDDFRTRYGFALVLEHHAPKAGSGVFRDLNPFGSSLFMRWPEIGLTLNYEDDADPDSNQYVLKIGRFRRDRVLNDWPQTIERNPRYQMAWYPGWATGRGKRLEIMSAG